jgi:hypothetical protein
VLTTRGSVGLIAAGAAAAAAGLALMSHLGAIEKINGGYFGALPLLDFATFFSFALIFAGPATVLVGGITFARREPLLRTIRLFLPIAILSLALLPVLNFNKEDWTAMLLFVLQAAVLIPVIVLVVALIVRSRPGNTWR